MHFQLRKSTDFLERRFFITRLVIIILFFTLVTRLWYLQVYKGSVYSEVSKNNRIRKIEISAPRGLIFDRNNELILGNKRFFDLVLIPQYVKSTEETLKIISNLLHVPYQNLYNYYKKNRGQAKFRPIIIHKNLTQHEVAKIRSSQFLLPGVEIKATPRRDYNNSLPVHLLGFLKEISLEEIKRLNTKNHNSKFFPNELIGKSGLEGRWDQYLRGRRGFSYVQVDAHGRKKNTLSNKKEFEFLGQSLIPGSDLTLTIDYKLQEVARKNFSNKYGAVIVINPQNGEILTLLSSPSYNPTIFQDHLSIEKWQELVHHPYKPFFDKTTGGVFPPASLYKPLIAMAALEEGIITPKTKHYCSGSFKLGSKTFHCHHRNGHSTIRLEEAMMKSCDVYFYKIGLELGINKIYKYARDLRLGQKLELNLNEEASGYIPYNSNDQTRGVRRYTKGDIPSLSIGQGATLLTPLQIASLYAAIANGGIIWEPYVVKKVTNHLGETVYSKQAKVFHKVSTIKPETFAEMRQVLFQVVQNPKASGRRARVKGVSVAGKTGSAQVVSLKKNRNRKDTVSTKWQEHALFAAFSPMDNAEIVVIVVSENDTVGGGSVSAAPVAQKIIAAYWNNKKELLSKR